ncbi:RICIN domain-containing protein [Streptomyces sp. HD]|uniref:RICIN domain-containing protein n=1 Tax=Streptomyces sp. HD TaxID=3020892 RepID=UPI00232FBD30|nr:RICIN domain-containing protein [Streptomyces sp. HD]MDC0769604.1 RICIN domain-containing protein [Streptomyces sp. HD]
MSAGRVLDEPAGRNGNGTPLQVWDAGGASNQQWPAGRNNDGSYTLTNVASGRALEVPSRVRRRPGPGRSARTAGSPRWCTWRPTPCRCPRSVPAESPG